MEPEITNPQFLMALLALEQKLISQDQLMGALRAWLVDPKLSLAQLLIDQAGVKPELVSALKQPAEPADLTVSLIDAHKQSEESSLDAALDELQKLVVDVPDLRQTLIHVQDMLGRVSPSIEAGSPLSNRSKTIGNYKLLQKIGEGGMGSVWMAEQERPVRRRVALKLIKAGADDQQVIARFEAERQALAMMDHINIARVLDAGATPTGQPFCVMELVQGIPITEYCDKHRLSLRERLELFVPVCNAVQHAHQKGIIHRDLKPSNVLVAQYDGKPVPKVIDFGLAKALQHQTKLSERTMFTEFGQVVGTLRYMSPEQAEMNALDVDTRTDIYSLGVMLYELLTGSTPLDKESVDKEPIFKVLEAIRIKEPPRPSTRLSSASEEAVTGISEQRQIEPRKLQRILRGELDWIVMKAIEKDRSRRFGTASDFAEDVERYLTGNAVHARPPSFAYQARKFIRRNRGRVIAASLIAVTLMTGLVGAAGVALFQLRAKRAESAAKQAEMAADAERAGKQAAEDAREIAERKTQLAQMAAEQESMARRIAEEAAKKEAEAKQMASIAKMQAEEAAENERVARTMAEESQLKARDAEAKASEAAAVAEQNTLYGLEETLAILLREPLETASERDLKRNLARRMFIAAANIRDRRDFNYGKSEALLWNSITQLGFAKEGMKAMTDAVAKRLQDNQPSEFVSWALAASNQLIELKQFTLAEPLLRECQAACEKANFRSEPVKLSMVNLLLGQQKITEAEQLLLQTYEQLSQPSTAESSKQVVDGRSGQLSPRDQLLRLVDRLITHYTSTNKPDEVAKWKEIASSLRSK